MKIRVEGADPLAASVGSSHVPGVDREPGPIRTKQLRGRVCVGPGDRNMSRDQVGGLPLDRPNEAEVFGDDTRALCLDARTQHAKKLREWSGVTKTRILDLRDDHDVGRGLLDELLQRRDTFTCNAVLGVESERHQLALRDGGHPAGVAGHALQRRVMVANDLAVGGEPNVGLDEVGAVPNGQVEGRETVFGREVRGSAMRHHPWPRTLQAEPLHRHVEPDLSGTGTVRKATRAWALEDGSCSTGIGTIQQTDPVALCLP